DDIGQICGPTRETLLHFGKTLRNFARVYEWVCDVRHEIPAADGEPQRRCDVGATDYVNFRSGGVKVPTQLENISKSLRVVGMHVGEENSSELVFRHPNLRQPHVRPTTSVKLQFDCIAVTAVIAVLNQRSGTGQPIEGRRAAP